MPGGSTPRNTASCHADSARATLVDMTANSSSKVVLVTGASSGIGEGIAAHLATTGHHVVAGARRKERLDALSQRVRAAGGSIDTHSLDVTDRSDFARFVAAALEEHDRIDVLVNNAGVMPLSRLDSLQVNEWNRMLAYAIEQPADVDVNELTIRPTRQR